MDESWTATTVGAFMQRGVAVLVDGENMAQSNADEILRRAEALGQLCSLRVYCDRANPNGWDADPRFQKIYLDKVSGKNSVDIRLVIDAMDIAHSGTVNAFVLVSTDSDFASLALRLRDPGFRVLGMGRPETSNRFRLACSEFHAIAPKPAAKPAPAPGTRVAPQPALSAMEQTVVAILREQGGAVAIAALNTLVHKVSDIRIGATPDRTWRAFLTRRPNLFTCDPKGPDARVRLKG